MLRFCIALLAIHVSAQVPTEEHFVRRVAIKIREDYQDKTLKTLSKYDFKPLYKITPQTYILEYQGSGRSYDLNILLKQLRNRYHHQILDIESVQVYEDTLKPESRTLNLNVSAHEDCFECGNYYGMGVPDAWSFGYTGKGVIIAVTDVGIHTDLIDLRNNINSDLCYNFIDDNKNVTPEFFHNLQEKASKFSSHGDNCASLIVAEFGNGICASGIAFNAKAVGMKIFIVTLYKEVFPELKPTFSTGSDIIARALVHNISKIDIFSNAWAPMQPFTPLPMVIEDAIEYGAKTGRHGLGTVYVVPAGPAGNGLANNIHTIAITGVGRNGTIPKDSFLSASVITSGLSEGSNISAADMYTTTRNNKCVTDFKGVSPATAQVAAIIALALEANPNLTLRDIQYLLIQASKPVGPSNANGFVKNKLGRFFHEMFGYGLVNAKKLITLANSTKTTNSPRLNRKAGSLRASDKTQDNSNLEFCYKCDEDKPCLGIIEHDMIKIKIPQASGLFRVVLESPSGTQSVLLHLRLSDEPQLKDVGYQQLTSVHFWDETAVGKWHLKLTGNLYGHSNRLEAELTLFGTEKDMFNLNKNICGNAGMAEQTNNSPKSNINNSNSTEIPRTSQVDGVVVLSFVILIVWFVITAIVAFFDLEKVKKKTKKQ